MKDAARDFAIHHHWPQAIVVYMKGVPTVAGNDPKGEQSGWQYHVGENGNRDVKFFDAVLADLRQGAQVDDKRICVAGFSNGAGFTFVLWSARGDQIAAVAACSMNTSQKMISTFKPKPFIHIAGKEDKLQPASALEKTALVVAKLNECDEGRPWGKKANCTIHPSKIGAPVIFYVHPGGHEVPKEVGPRIVEFFKQATQPGQKLEAQPSPNLETQPSKGGNPAVGVWQLNQPSLGESKLQITEKEGKLEVQEIGRGNARGTTSFCQDGLLVIHWEVYEDLRGYWLLNLNEENTKGTGKTVFVRTKDFYPGEAREIEGRKVRVIEGVTIERIGSSVP